jgi:hypothetical protein
VRLVFKIARAIAALGMLHKILGGGSKSRLALNKLIIDIKER